MENVKNDSYMSPLVYFNNTYKCAFTCLSLMCYQGFLAPKLLVYWQKSCCYHPHNISPTSCISLHWSKNFTLRVNLSAYSFYVKIFSVSFIAVLPNMIDKLWGFFLLHFSLVFQSIQLSYYRHNNSSFSHLYFIVLILIN